MYRQRKLAGVITSIIAGAMLLTSTALAAWDAAGRSTNILSMSSYKTSIEEQYQVPHHVNPSEEIKKVVNIKNEGTVDTYIRLKVEKVFGVRNPQGKLTADRTLDPEMIIIRYNTDYWKMEDDGYWYYTDILKAGATTKEPLFESYKLSENAGNEYKGKDAEIVVTMESIQAEGSALEALWGVSARSLGVAYEAPETDGSATQVIFKKDRKFSFQADGTDLFTSFKNLLPGCSRTQSIKFRNDSSEAVEIFLRAEAAKQDQMSDAQLKLVEQLLSEYAEITVKAGDAAIYKGTVDGNLNGLGGGTMKNDISLGMFKAGEGKHLTVTLSLSPEMDNGYQELIGKVDWIFTAKGEDAAQGYETIGRIGPKTGDENHIIWSVSLLTGSILLIVVSARLRKGKKAL